MHHVGQRKPCWVGSINLQGWGLGQVPAYRVVLMIILWQLCLHPLGLSRKEKALERAGTNAF